MGTIEPRLSILIPSIPSRISRVETLINKIQCQIGDLPVEVLCLIDNKSRSIGLKREALVQSARGMFLAFVDDDDDVMDDYIKELVQATYESPSADVIVFDQSVTINGGNPVIVKHGIEYENTEVNSDGATRKPWHIMAYSRMIAQSCHFPDASYGEDWHWVQQAWPKVVVQHRIDAVLHHYIYSDDTTEAEIDYPENDHPPEKDDDPIYTKALHRTMRKVFALHPYISVIDIGCNTGRWCRAAKDESTSIHVVGIDSPHIERYIIPGSMDRFIGANLREHIEPVGKFDLVICLNVAEHIPAPYVDIFMGTICSHGWWVLFSATPPGQGGWQHYNEQELEYWIAKFKLRGYEPDYRITHKIPEELPETYKKNMVMFVRKP